MNNSKMEYSKEDINKAGESYQIALSDLGYSVGFIGGVVASSTGNVRHMLLEEALMSFMEALGKFEAARAFAVSVGFIFEKNDLFPPKVGGVFRENNSLLTKLYKLILDALKNNSMTELEAFFDEHHEEFSTALSKKVELGAGRKVNKAIVLAKREIRARKDVSRSWNMAADAYLDALIALDNITPEQQAAYEWVEKRLAKGNLPAAMRKKSQRK